MALLCCCHSCSCWQRDHQLHRLLWYIPVRGLPGHIIFLRGLSFDVTTEDVAAWFHDLSGLSRPVTSARYVVVRVCVFQYMCVSGPSSRYVHVYVHVCVFWGCSVKCLRAFFGVAAHRTHGTMR